MLLERTAEPEVLAAEEERLVAVLREVVLPAVLRFTLEPRLVAEPVLRVRSVWSTVPAERAVEEPVLRLVVAAEELPEERLVV